MKNDLAIMIRECLDTNFVESTEAHNNDSLDLTEAFHNNSDDIDPDSLMVEIEGIHAAPFVTRNYTRYMPKALKNSLDTWTHPYRIPVIKHHNEENGDIIGRVIEAKYLKNSELSGTPALKFVVNVPDEKAKKDIKSGLLATTSIGVIANDVRCSVCGKPILDENGCEDGHCRGVTYKTEEGYKTCYWDIYDIVAKELSFVVVPSDMYSIKTDCYPAAKKSSDLLQKAVTESLDNTIQEKGDQQMADTNKLTELEEATAKVSELESKVRELAEALTASESKVAELTEAHSAAEAKVAELEESKTQLETEIAEAAQLKETMEQEIADTKAALKESMTEQFVTLRESLGNTVKDVDKIKERSIESLRDSISDMKESFSAKFAEGGTSIKESVEEKKDDPAKLANSVEDPTVGKQDLKESTDEPRIDLKEGLNQLFSSVFNARA